MPNLKYSNLFFVKADELRMIRQKRGVTVWTPHSIIFNIKN